MAWNGRNESILGASSKPIAPVAPTPKQADSETPLPIKTKITTTTTTTNAAGAPPPNAWNGRNTKIMEVLVEKKASKTRVLSFSNQIFENQHHLYV